MVAGKIAKHMVMEFVRALKIREPIPAPGTMGSRYPASILGLGKSHKKICMVSMQYLIYFNLIILKLFFM